MNNELFKHSDVFIAMPVYNEGEVAVETIAQLKTYGYNLVAVDDGSTDNTFSLLRSIDWIHTLNHIVNLGQGAALQTAISYALICGAKFIVTFDSDGQHPADKINLALEMLIREKADVILGSRFLSESSSLNIPSIKRAVLRLATFFTRLSCKIMVSDTHNGFRIFKADSAKKINITQNRMSHATQILSQISKKKLQYLEIPITVQYTKYSMNKGQKISNSLNILWDSFFSKY